MGLQQQGDCDTRKLQHFSLDETVNRQSKNSSEEHPKPDSYLNQRSGQQPESTASLPSKPPDSHIRSSNLTSLIGDASRRGSDVSSKKPFRCELVDLLQLNLNGNFEDGFMLLEGIREYLKLSDFEYFAVQRPDYVSIFHHVPSLGVVISHDPSKVVAWPDIATEGELSEFIRKVQGSKLEFEAMGPQVWENTKVFQAASIPAGLAFVRRVKFPDADEFPVPPMSMTTPSDTNEIDQPYAALSAGTSFATAFSGSMASYHTARGASLMGQLPWSSTPPAKISTSMTPWKRFLQERRLLPTAFEEQNWSGRGQHAEYSKAEASQVPLRTCGRVLSHSTSAFVEVVRCRRITLARKTIHCSQRRRREDAAKEVEHLQRINDAHVVRVIGTYVFEHSRNLQILIYPVADCDLETFMEEEFERVALERFFVCLGNTLAYLHRMLIKHMDIKPKNILVKHHEGAAFESRKKVYLADFGIARSYESATDAETCSPTAYIRIYAAPEVVAQDTRGLKADIFSLGCVFAEMLCALAGSRKELRVIRESNTADSSFQGNIDVVRRQIERLPIEENTTVFRARNECLTMLDSDPEKRPTSETLCQIGGAHVLDLGCCHDGAEQLEATEDMG